MSGFQLFGKFFTHLFWPLKGIIFLEVYLLTWVWAFLRADFMKNGVILLIVLTIFVCIGVTLEMRTRRIIGHFFGHVLRYVFALLIRIVLAWVYLVIGVTIGRMDNRFQPPTVTVNANGHHVNLSVSNRTTTLHYRMGRGIYRLLNRGLNRIIPGRYSVVAVILARIIAILIAIWGVWDIPTFLLT